MPARQIADALSPDPVDLWFIMLCMLFGTFGPDYFFFLRTYDMMDRRFRDPSMVARDHVITLVPGSHLQ